MTSETSWTVAAKIGEMVSRRGEVAEIGVSSHFTSGPAAAVFCQQTIAPVA
jgi:hypothetical protein